MFGIYTEIEGFLVFVILVGVIINWSNPYVSVNRNKSFPWSSRDIRLILKSPNGTRYNITVDNSGNITASSI